MALRGIGLDYTLVRHQRDPQTLLSPPALKALHPLGAAPVIEDDGVLRAESLAVVETVPRRISVRLSDDLAAMDGVASLAMTIDWRQVE